MIQQSLKTEIVTATYEYKYTPHFIRQHIDNNLKTFSFSPPLTADG